MAERKCTVTSGLEIVPAGLPAYERLSHFHYRDTRIGPYVATYAIKDTHPVRGRFGEVVGVIVYTMPAISLELRNVATDGFFTGLGSRAMQLKMLNENIRCISRVIIEPRYRGLGLASLLVRQTMPKPEAPIIEALAVMGQVNPFFEKAGMKAYTAKTPQRCVQLLEALSMIGIEADKASLLNPEAVQKSLDGLDSTRAEFIERQFRRFLQCYGKRRNMPTGVERTRFVLSKLTFRPVYYIWFNPDVPIRVGKTLTAEYAEKKLKLNTANSANSAVNKEKN